ncbi:MAG: hypothetical protein Q7S40_18530 [Opitutaceae bacterium]|nr:hypothetical protein [Opitutaceae bacterium]
MGPHLMPLARPTTSASPHVARWLQWAFVFPVLAFAWLRFSDNTADNDLWGHVLYGQRMLALGRIETTDVLSWTAAGERWINHETAAELVLALVHRAGGSAGLWFFMMGMAAVTLTWAGVEGTRGRARAAVTLTLLAVSTNFIAMGYAVRPQLFTMLGFVALLATLRRFLSGRLAWGWLLPPLFAAWVNFHGGYLAGWLVLLLAVGVETATRFSHRSASTDAGRSFAAPLLLVVSCTAALAANPEGFHLLAWTLQTVRLPRPSITEWQPMPLSLSAVPFFFVVASTLLAWMLSRRPRHWWQAAVLAVLAVMAVLQQRHAPLFGLANLIFTPEHLADALSRLAVHVRGLIETLHQPAMQAVVGLGLAAAGVAAIAASLRLPREHAFAIEVPADVYPVSAIAFIREHALEGNTITFFDWGQQVLWELPRNPVSFDGRLDTVYSRAVMDAHWRFYAGEPPGPALDFARAAVALLPTASGGVDVLRRNGWKLAYRDPLAAVLVRNPADFPRLAAAPHPVLTGPSALQGRARFPDQPPLLATATRPR